MTTKEIIKRYYDGIAHKDGWQSIISDEITFTGAGPSTKGKDAYITATTRFLGSVKGSSITDLIIEGNKACALVNYELLSPKGNTANCVVAEILKVNEDKITASTIFFDTAAFRNFIAQG